MPVPEKQAARPAPPLPSPPNPGPVKFGLELEDEIEATAASPLGRDDASNGANGAVAAAALPAQTRPAVVPPARPERPAPIRRAAPPVPETITEPLTGHVAQAVARRSRRFCTEYRHSVSSLVDLAFALLWENRTEAQLDAFLRERGYAGKRRADAVKATTHQGR